MKNLGTMSALAGILALSALPCGAQMQINASQMSQFDAIQRKTKQLKTDGSQKIHFVSWPWHSPTPTLTKRKDQCHLTADLDTTRIYIGGVHIKEYTNVFQAVEDLTGLISDNSCALPEIKNCYLTPDLGTFRVYYGGGHLLATNDNFEARKLMTSLKGLGICREDR